MKKAIYLLILFCISCSKYGESSVRTIEKEDSKINGDVIEQGTIKEKRRHKKDKLIPVTSALVTENDVIHGNTKMQSKNDFDCKKNLKEMYGALIQYKIEFGKNRYYPRLKGDKIIIELYRKGCIKKKEILYCPNWEDNDDIEAKTPDGLSTDYDSLDNRSDSKLNLFAMIMKKTPVTEIPLIWDKKGNHIGYRLVLFLDGHVEKIIEDDFVKHFGKHEE